MAKTNKQPNKNALYVIKEFPYGKNQLVLHVRNDFQEGYLCFYDTERGHMIEGKLEQCVADGFSFIDKRERKWEFKEVSIDEFRENLCDKIVNGKEIADLCRSTEELWQYYRKEFPI